MGNPPYSTSLPGIVTCRILASVPATSRQLSDQMLHSPLSFPGKMLLPMFILLCPPAKVYSLSSTIDDTISEQLVDPSDVSYISDQVNEVDSLFIERHIIR